MNTPVLPQPKVIVNPSRARCGDYDRLSVACDKVMLKGRLLRRGQIWEGRKVPITLCELTDKKTGLVEPYAVVVVTRTDKHGRDWIAANFVSVANPAKGRRVVVEPSGKVWLLLDDECRAIWSMNKYAEKLAQMVGK